MRYRRFDEQPDVNAADMSDLLRASANNDASIFEMITMLSLCEGFDEPGSEDSRTTSQRREIQCMRYIPTIS